jgi:CheY-like chemotaxis protein
VPAISEILVVEDDHDHGLMLTDALTGWGYAPVLARDGHEAIRYLMGSVSLGLPRLVILDLMMPGMSGWDVLDRMREVPRLLEVPVVVMTALRSRRDYAPPIVAFLRKPYTLDDLFAMVRKIVGTA